MPKSIQSHVKLINAHQEKFKLMLICDEILGILQITIMFFPNLLTLLKSNIKDDDTQVVLAANIYIFFVLRLKILQSQDKFLPKVLATHK